jgi:preprotein translocase subunit YajC
MTKMSSVFSAFEFLGQTAGPGGAPGGMSGMTMVLFYGLFIAAMYFLMIAPQRKKAKEQEKLIASIQSGDEIVTNSGIFGTITNVKDDRFIVRIADNTKIELAKGFVQTVLKKPADEKK